MIPYFEYHVIPLGPLKVQVWGLFAAVGMVLAVWVGARESRRRGLDPAAFVDFCTAIMAGAFVGARLLHALAYAPGEYLADPFKLLRVWEGGLSSIGGFVGAGVTALWFAKRRKMRFRDYGDVAAYALPLGYGCGRIGCFLIHDHPGTLSNSPLAVDYPGGPRLDHGLLLAVVGFALFAAFWAVNRRGPARYRAFLPLFMVSYGGIRFALDFLRATDLAVSDPRYLGLTPAQYAALAMIVGGAWLLRTDRHHENVQERKP